MAKPKMTESAEALSIALNELQGLQLAYDDASSAANAASRAQTDAVNKLNTKQKEVDRLFGDVRAAGSGDWSSDLGRPVPTPKEPKS